MISDPIKIALVVSIAPTIVSMVAVVKLFINGGHIKAVHKELNSRLSQWKEETKAANVEAVIAAYERGKKEQAKTGETKS